MSNLISGNGLAPRATSVAPYVETPPLRLELDVADPEVAAALRALPAGRQRERFALTALRIGVAALHNARGEVDADAVRSESERWLEQMRAALARHREGLMQEMTTGLKDYFDPESGRFEQRLTRLIRRDGELEQLLRRQVASDDSELARTLAGYIGPDSELRRLLCPDAPDGLPQVLQQVTAEALRESRERILSEFSLDNDTSALSRLVRELRERHGEMSKDVRGSVERVVGEFSLDREDSALSRLVGRVETARKKISDEFSLDSEGSALARLKRELETLLNQHREESEKFRSEVREALTQMNARHAESLRSTRHGGDFEAGLCTAVRALLRDGGDVVDAVGNETGVIRNCKTGDIVVTLGAERRARGAKIVIEAKQQAGYGVSAALDEIARARKNRSAQVGVFVYSARSAPADLEPLVRYGNDLVVVWDADDAATDLYLRAALSVAQAIASRAHDSEASDQIDPDAFDRAVRAIEKQVCGLGQIRTWAETITSNGTKIRDKAGIMARKIEREVERLDGCTRDLRRALARVEEADSGR